MPSILLFLLVREFCGSSRTGMEQKELLKAEKERKEANTGTYNHQRCYLTHRTINKKFVLLIFVGKTSFAQFFFTVFLL